MQTPWEPDSRLPEDLAADIAQVINAMPKTHSQPPQPGEEFETFDTAAERCHNYAFASGRCPVFTKKDVKKEMRARFRCKHHGTETRNTRKCTEEERNKKDDKGRHLARPNTCKTQLDCRFSLGISFRKVVDGATTPSLTFLSTMSIKNVAQKFKTHSTRRYTSELVASLIET